MTKQAPGFQKPNPKNEYQVGIESAANTIMVTRDHFWVSKPKNEVAEWFCLNKDHDPTHVHSNNCFKIVFDPNNHPFKTHEFISNADGYASSGHVRDEVKGDNNKHYKYTVAVGNRTLDPQGGVRP